MYNLKQTYFYIFYLICKEETFYKGQCFMYKNHVRTQDN